MKGRRTAAGLAYAGGGLLFLAGASGATALVGFAAGTLADLAERAVGAAAASAVLFLAWPLAVLASLGGLTVIVGAWVIQRRNPRVGSFLVLLGAGAGALGLLLDVFVLVADPRALLGYLGGVVGTLGGLGFILCLAARVLVLVDTAKDRVRSFRRSRA